MNIASKINIALLTLMIPVMSHAAYDEDLVNRFVPESVRDDDTFTVLGTILILAVVVALAIWFGSSIMSLGAGIVAKFSDMVSNRANNENAGFLGVALAGVIVMAVIAFAGFGVFSLIDGYQPPTFNLDASG